MRAIDVTVNGSDGRSVEAEMLLCESCNHSEETPTLWIIFLIRGHPHFQCSECGVSYCANGETCVDS
jgi:hypothetical protein